MKISEILDFYDVPSSFEFDLPPVEAISRFRAKGLRQTFAWQDMVGEEHALSFTVAKMLDTDLLADVHASLVEALETGKTFGNWADEIVPLLQSRGWWGRQPVIDPLTGTQVVAALGTPARLKTIFRTNMASAYAAGAWETIEEQSAEASFLLYDAIDDFRTRPEHAAWDGRVYPVNSVFWQAHYPPNGWNCRCSVIQLNEDEIAELGLEVSPRFRGEGTYEWTNPRTGRVIDVPNGVDPGFAVDPSTTRLKVNAKLAEEKADALPPEIKPSAIAGLEAAKLAAKSKIPEWKTTEAGQWHAKSFDKSPDFIKSFVANTQDVSVSYQKAPKTAWAWRDTLVNMGKGGEQWRETKEGQATWRHEFGHIIDFRYGSVVQFGNLVKGRYLSSSTEFESRFSLDRNALLARYNKRNESLKKARDEEYLSVRNKFIDNDKESRPKLLEDLAKSANINLEEFVEFLRVETFILEGSSIESLGVSVRIGKMLKALELRDPEEFIRLAVFRDADSTGPEFNSVRGLRSWAKSGSLGMLSDLIGALTKNYVCGHKNGFFGHSDAYYRKSPSNANTEVFANAIDMLSNPNPLWAKIAKTFAPSTMQKMEEFINDKSRLE